MNINIIISIVIVAILLNIIVSIFLYHRDDLDSFQKIFQIILVWLVPFVAAIGLYFFNRSHDLPTKAKKQAFGGGSANSHAADGGGDG